MPSRSTVDNLELTVCSSVANHSHLTTLSLQPAEHWNSLHNAEEFLGLDFYLLTSGSADLCSCTFLAVQNGALEQETVTAPHGRVIQKRDHYMPGSGNCRGSIFQMNIKSKRNFDKSYSPK